MHPTEKMFWLEALKQAKKQKVWKPVCDFTGSVTFKWNQIDHWTPYCPKCIVHQFATENERSLRKELKLKPENQMLTAAGDFEYFDEFSHFLPTCTFFDLARLDWSDIEGVPFDSEAEVDMAKFNRRMERANGLECAYWAGRIIDWLEKPEKKTKPKRRK